MARRATYYANSNAVITATGNYPLRCGQSYEIDWQGGNGALFVVGTWDGATAKLQIQAPDASTWLDIGSGTTFTSNNVGGFIAPAGPLRVAVSGAGAATSLSASIAGIPTNNGG